MVRPKKHLGQHFLTDRNIAERITQLFKAEEYDTIMEIGPGKGILTSFLMKRVEEKLVLIEIDRESVEYLKDLFPLCKSRIIEGDFLKMDLPGFGNRMAVIGNFPYNISSQIFFRILEYREQVDEIVCMLQKEVALRLASGPGNKQYGILSVLLQAWYDISIEFHVKPGAFFPPPNVQSTVIRLTRNGRNKMDCDEKLFTRLVKTGFNQRRKMLSNSLKSILLTLEPGIPFLTRRPEELSVEQFILLCNYLEENELIK
ncbi:MAG: 16S rRNA (adenine(1518)-N(6)/adenine(1519)-N(6))-dimethyltransferase RsmA [Bacteroidales bacterium]|nr:16S rRNA (adenine(1518)-N(6)/adenine(1519)-N(6))-dimethyltransferase RsmA [Bacteroidales bacterium]